MHTKYTLFRKIFLSNFFRLQSPYHLTFALTYKCNLKCKTCLIWAKPQKKEISISTIEKFFKKSNYFSWIDLTGGEISLREDLIEIIKIILKYNRQLCILHFPTNGQLTKIIIDTVEEIRKCSKKVTPIITVSIDGPQKIHDEIRGCKDSWEKALRTFNDLKRLRVNHTYLGYTFSQYNYGQLKNTFLAIKARYPQLSWGDIHINIAHNSRHYFANTSLPFNLDGALINDELNEVINSKKWGIKGFLEQRYFSMISTYLLSRRMPLKCQALSSTCFIDAYGDIYPCVIYYKKIGNICDIDYDLAGAWNKQNTISLRGNILSKECNGCWTPCEAYPAILGSTFKRN